MTGVSAGGEVAGSAVKFHGGVDHLVVVAASLDEGVAWCEATLGVTPDPGGEHPLMGTHNRLLSVASPQFERAYLEIIAIHEGAPKSIPASDKRWFDMDSSALRQCVGQHGPQLVHWVARVADVAVARSTLRAWDLDPGQPVQASRATALGLLEWQITIRPDGQRQLGGCLPTLIQWGNSHPTDALPASGVTLQALSLTHPEPDAVTEALHALGMKGLPVQRGSSPGLHAVLSTPRGQVSLTSVGLP